MDLPVISQFSSELFIKLEALSNISFCIDASVFFFFKRFDLLAGEIVGCS